MKYHTARDMPPIPVEKGPELEKQVEVYLCREVKALGGECYKWSSPNNRGVPDRIAVLPNGDVWFLELKREKNTKTTGPQIKFQERMAQLNRGYFTRILRGRKAVDAWLEEVKRTLPRR